MKVSLLLYFLTLFRSYNLDEVKVRNVSFLLYLNLGEI